jgi:ABC-2 type transport system ATP-binding protein
VSIAVIEGLTVRYGQFLALNSLTLEVPEGCTGLLGPNGAGKTSLLRTFLGLVKPASGRATLLGKDIVKEGHAIRQLVGYMPEQDCHIPGMTAVEYVAFAGELSGLPPNQAIRRAHEVIEYCGLGEARYRQIETYSTGMKQRAKLAQALVHGPKLLLLDEPTNGLDPRGREDMLELVRSISREKGVSVIVSSHLLKDIERTCESVVVILKGSLRASGPIRDLKSIQGRPIDLELRLSVPGFAEAAQKHGLQVVWEAGPKLRVWADATPAEASRMIFAAARDSGAQVRSLAPAVRSLEDAFLEVVSHA